GHVVAFVSRAPAAASRARTLEQAGAKVRVSSPELDLWSVLGEEAFDALVLLVSGGEPSASALVAALEGDPRTRALPVLVLVEPRFAAEAAQAASSKSVTILSTEAPGEALVRAVVDLS